MLVELELELELELERVLKKRLKKRVTVSVRKGQRAAQDRAGIVEVGHASPATIWLKKFEVKTVFLNFVFPFC